MPGFYDNLANLGRPQGSLPNINVSPTQPTFQVTPQSLNFGNQPLANPQVSMPENVQPTNPLLTGDRLQQIGQFGQIGLQGLQTLSGIYFGAKQLSQAKKMFNFQKNLANANYLAQVKAFNNSQEDVARGRQTAVDPNKLLKEERIG